MEFGVQSAYDSDIISVKNLNNEEAGIYLEKELDREVRIWRLKYTCWGYFCKKQLHKIYTNLWENIFFWNWYKFIRKSTPIR